MIATAVVLMIVGFLMILSEEFKWGSLMMIVGALFVAAS